MSNLKEQGDIAQMVERSLSMREVSGSIPDISIFIKSIEKRDLKTFIFIEVKYLFLYNFFLIYLIKFKSLINKFI